MKVLSVLSLAFFFALVWAQTATQTDTSSNTVSSSMSTTVTVSSTSPKNGTSNAGQFVPYVPTCGKTNPDCNGQGVCQTDGSCRCFYGWFGVVTVGPNHTIIAYATSFGGTADNCAFNARSVFGDHSLNQLRIFVGVAFGILTVIIFYRIILEVVFWVKDRSTTKLSAKFISRATMVLTFVLSLWITVQSGDFIGVMAMSLKSTVYDAWISYMVFYYSFYTAVWILFALGYIFFGLRLLRIIPDVLKGSIVSVMILMAVFAIFAVAYECLSIGLQLSSVGLSKVETVIAMFVLIWFCVFAAVNIFMPVWQWHKWLNPSVIHKLMSETSTNKTSSKSQDSQMSIITTGSAQPLQQE